jgi:4'-phosphopantetheinyl transferase
VFVSLLEQIPERAASAAPTPTIADNCIHLWRIPVEAWESPRGGFREWLTQWLTPPEQARAARFAREEDRVRFQLGRAATRCIIGRYLALPAGEILIEAGPHGKPQLGAVPVAARAVHFNLSHSGGWILVAFARSFPLGIDVETLTAQRLTAELIEHVMCAGEREALQALPPEQRAAAFFKCWTSKEAFLKGLGAGLSVSLRAIEVSIDPGAPAQLLAAPSELQPSDWQLRSLEFSSAYAATLAALCEAPQIVDCTLSSWRELQSTGIGD